MLCISSKSFAVYLYVNFPSVSTLKILSGFYYYRVSSLGVLKMIYLKNSHKYFCLHYHCINYALTQTIL